MRFSHDPPRRDWQIDPQDVRLHGKFIAEVMRHWDLGRDTAQVAELTFEKEAVVARALHLGREQRRQGQ